MWVNFLAVPMILMDGTTPNGYVWHILSCLSSQNNQVHQCVPFRESYTVFSDILSIVWCLLLPQLAPCQSPPSHLMHRAETQSVYLAIWPHPPAQGQAPQEWLTLQFLLSNCAQQSQARCLSAPSCIARRAMRSLRKRRWGCRAELPEVISELVRGLVY